MIQQAKQFKPKAVLIVNKKFYNIVKKKLRKYKIKIYSGDISICNIISKKIDYVMSAIVGIAGLRFTLDSIKVSRNVIIANKESIICGWDIIEKYIKKFKTNILPVDSEHFSIQELTKGVNNDDIEEIIITASGGPFLNLNNKKLKSVTPSQAIKHPTWSMGKKISVDSANLMNKVFEVIEACKIFNFNKKKYKILIHPQSYVHSIIRFKNGLVKMILHEPDMKIPISHTLLNSKFNNKRVGNIDPKMLSRLNFQKVNIKQFPSYKLIEKCLNGGFLAPTIVNASNEVLVDLFLNNKIKFTDIVKNINKLFKDNNFKKYAKKKPMSIKDIEIADNWARLKTIDMCVR